MFRQLVGVGILLCDPETPGDLSDPTERLSSKTLLKILELNLAPDCLESIGFSVLVVFLTEILFFNRNRVTSLLQPESCHLPHSSVLDGQQQEGQKKFEIKVGLGPR